MKKENRCTCLYISYDAEKVFLWILKSSGAIYFRNIEVDKKTVHTRLAKVARNLDEFFAIMAESFRSFGILPDEVCKDRSLNDIEPKLESCQEESLERFRQGSDMDDPEPSLRLFYEMFYEVQYPTYLTSVKSSLFLIAACTVIHSQLCLMKVESIYQRLSESGLLLL